MNKRKISKNSKITRFECFRCKTSSVKTRRDSKFCSSLCRVQESTDRKEAGFIHRVCVGTKADVMRYFQDHIQTFDYGQLKSMQLEVEEWVRQIPDHQCAKKEFGGVLIYHFPQIKRACCEIYLTEQMNTALQSAKKREAILTRSVVKIHRPSSVELLS